MDEAARPQEKSPTPHEMHVAASPDGQERDMTDRSRSEDRSDALIASYIEPHPAKSGIANYRLKVEEGGYPVWAIIGNLTPGILTETQVAHDFRLSREALDAVLAFYAQHKEAIDTWLIVNHAG